MVEEGLDPDTHLFESDTGDEEDNEEVEIDAVDEESVNSDQLNGDTSPVKVNSRLSQPNSRTGNAPGSEQIKGTKREAPNPSLIVQVGEQEDLDYDIERSAAAVSLKEEDTAVIGEAVLKSPPSKQAKVQPQGKKISEDSSKPATETSVDQCKNLWVNNISQTVKAAELKTLFSKHGRVLSAKIVMNAKNPQGCCFGFLLMDSVSDADRCIKNLDKAEFYGNKIVIEKTKSEPIASRIPSKKSGNSSGVKASDDKDKKKISATKTPVATKSEAPANRNPKFVPRSSANDTYRKNGETMYDKMKTSRSAAAILARAKVRRTLQTRQPLRLAARRETLIRRPFVERRERDASDRRRNFYPQPLPQRNLNRYRNAQTRPFNDDRRRIEANRYRYENSRTDSRDFQNRHLDSRDASDTPAALRRIEEEKYRLREERLRLEQAKVLLDMQVAQATALRMQRMYEDRSRRDGFREPARRRQDPFATSAPFRRPEPPAAAIKRRRSPIRDSAPLAKVPRRYEAQPRPTVSESSSRYKKNVRGPIRRDNIIRKDAIRDSYTKRIEPSSASTPNNSSSRKRDSYESQRRPEPRPSSRQSSRRDSTKDSRVQNSSESRRTDTRVPVSSNYRSGWLGAPQASYYSGSTANVSGSSAYGRSPWITASGVPSSHTSSYSQPDRRAPHRDESSKDRSFGRGGGQHSASYR